MALEHSHLVDAGLRDKTMKAAVKFGLTAEEVLQLIIKYGPDALKIIEDLGKLRGKV